jgi:hypothetical protein
LIVERRAARFAAPVRLAILRRLGMAGRLAAFALILVGAAMIPAPVRAGEALEEAAVETESPSEPSLGSITSASR